MKGVDKRLILKGVWRQSRIKEQSMATQETPPTPSDSKLEVSDIYGPLIELTIHGQDNKLNLFSSFLFFQSILLLAWATVWQISLPGRTWILLIFSSFGIFSSVIWAILSSDYANAGRRFSETGAQFEDRYFPLGVPHFLSAREEIVASKPTWKTGRFLIASVTWGFVVLYALLDLTLLCKPN
jgi:hypothetical protein